MISVSWDECKRLIATGLRYRYVNVLDGYEVLLNDGSIVMQCHLKSGDADEFDASYKAGAQDMLFFVDSDGSNVVQPKTTRAGWRYEPRNINIKTGTLNSLHNTDPDDNDIGDAVERFFDATGTELTQGGAETDAAFQGRLTANCVVTAIDFQPTFDIDLIGGDFSIADTPTAPVYMHALLAPDIPVGMGGSVPFANGGFDLASLRTGIVRIFDGRGVKSIPYDPVYNSNKLRVTMRHSLGEVVRVQITVDLFKA